MHHPYDELIAQEHNVGWDARLRRRYVVGIVTFATLWTGAVLLAGLVYANSTEPPPPTVK